MQIHENLMFIAKNKEGLQIYNINKKETPQLVSSYEFNGRINEIEYSNNHLFLATGINGIIVLNISDIENPIQVANYDSYWITTDLSINDKYIATAEVSGGVLLFEFISGGDNNDNGDDDDLAPTNFNLSQNYPNPFNSGTLISYSIPQIGSTEELSFDVTLKIYDVLGQQVTTLVNQKQTYGEYQVQFNSTILPSGIYFYRLRAGDTSTGSAQSFTETKKMVLLR